MSSSRGLTTTSYALLGLLAIRSWSSYELTRQMEWSLEQLRAAGEEQAVRGAEEAQPRLGLATSRTERTGQRRRTVYTITAKGRRALAEWQSEPSTGSALEAEPLLRVFLADQGTRADTLATLAAARAWAEERGDVQATWRPVERSS